MILDTSLIFLFYLVWFGFVFFFFKVCLCIFPPGRNFLVRSFGNILLLVDEILLVLMGSNFLHYYFALVNHDLRILYLSTTRSSVV
jgi:hypothetical protein